MSLLTRSASVLLALTFSPLAAQESSFLHPDGTTHWYRVVRVPTGIDWPTAHRAAAAAGGYLATLTSAAENAFVFGLVDDPDFWSGTTGPWIGGVQAPRANEPAGGWGWVEPEAFAFGGWAAGEPNDDQGADRLHFGVAGSGRAATWADAPATRTTVAYVVEFSGPGVLQTSGLRIQAPGAHDGYTLIAPLSSTSTWLVDARGRNVHSWLGRSTPVACYLEPFGNLLRAESRINPRFGSTGGATGVVGVTDWHGNRLWEFTLSTDTVCLHHDVERLPNGNLLMIAWHLVSEQEAIAAGRNPSSLWEQQLWPDKIIEVQPTATGGRIVWEWRAWDHLVQALDAKKPNYGVVSQHPGRIHVNYPTNSGDPDWLHFNAIDYNAALDQIVISVPNFDEIWVIDHSTTTQEAAGSAGGRWGRGGEILYRWGNPHAYGRGTANDGYLEFQHDARWIPQGRPGAGNLLVFDNGRWRKYSRVVELTPPTDAHGNYVLNGQAFGPSKPGWSYEKQGEFLSTFISGAERLPSGNTLVCSGADARVFEVTPSGEKVWEYINPISRDTAAGQGAAIRGNAIFRAPWYEAESVVFAGRDLDPEGPLELYASALLVDGARVTQRVSPGATVELTLQAPRSLRAGRMYKVATSATPGLLPVDWRFARIGVDPLLHASLDNASPTVFANYAGTFDALGRATARLEIPHIAGLAGLDLYTLFVEIDPGAPSSLSFVSNTVKVEVR